MEIFKIAVVCMLAVLVAAGLYVAYVQYVGYQKDVAYETAMRESAESYVREAELSKQCFNLSSNPNYPDYYLCQYSSSSEKCFCKVIGWNGGTNSIQVNATTGERIFTESCSNGICVWS